MTDLLLCCGLLYGRVEYLGDVCNICQRQRLTDCFGLLQKVVHRDLTSYNLLVTDKWECKLADFNLSRAIKETQIPHSGQINSPEWSAPERLSGQVCARSLSCLLRSNSPAPR